MDHPGRSSASNSGNGRSSRKRSARQGIYQAKEYHLPASSSVKEFAHSAKVYSDYRDTERPMEVTSRKPLVAVSSSALPQYRQPLASSRIGSGRGSPHAHKKSPAAETSTSVLRPPMSRSSPRLPSPTPSAAAYSPKLQSDAPKSSPSMANDRFDAFMMRIGKSPIVTQADISKGDKQREEYTSHGPAHSAQHPESPELDHDFIKAFAKEHQLELAVEISKELAANSARRAAEATTTTPTTPQLPFIGASDTTPVAPGPAIPATMKPPRPPRSERRISQSPGTLPTVAATLQYKGSATSADARQAKEADGRQVSGTAISRPHPPETTLLKPALASKSGLDEPYHTYYDASPPQAIIREAEETAIIAEDAITEALSSAAESQSQDDYERDRRLSSLFHGLGIHSLDLGTSIGREASLPEEGSNSSSVSGSYSGCSESFASAEEGEEDVWGYNYPGEREQPAEIRQVRTLQSTRSLSRRSTRASRSPSTPFTSSPGRGYEALIEKASRVTRQASKRSIRQRVQTVETPPSPHLPTSPTPHAEYWEDQHFNASDETAPPSQIDINQNMHGLAREPRISSLGADESVLAAILAAESFCLPPGTELDFEELAARYSMNGSGVQVTADQLRLRKSIEDMKRASIDQRRSMGRLRSQNRATPFCSTDLSQQRIFYQQDPSHDSLHAPSPLLAPSDHSHSSYTAPFSGTVSSANSSMIWDTVDTPATEVYTPFDGAPIPVEKNGYLLVREREDTAERNLSADAEPDFIEQLSQQETVPVKAGRRRSMSTDIFHKFSGSSVSGQKPKGRKRLTSFFGGSDSVTREKIAEGDVPVQEASARANHNVSRPSSPSLNDPPPSLTRPNARKRALTGPARLIDIANLVTNTPPPAVRAGPTPPLPAVAGHTPVGASTWRSTVPDNIYEQMTAIHSKNELRRQEVIVELCQTEDAFVNGLKGVIRLFSRPLRTPQGHWMAGIPMSISQLLDHLDAIVLVHGQMVASLQHCRASQGLVVLRIADALLPYVSQLDVHQPYLIKFESVTREIEDLSCRPDSEFGEFVRIQQALPECGAMTLSSFLLKPVQRLMKYPLFFKQLRDLTPPDHPDHGPSEALFQSCDALIRIMQEVKVREEEYEQIKSFCGRITGLPTGLILAKRDRRLLAQGQMRRVHLSDKDRLALDPTYANAATTTIVLSPNQSQTSLASLDPGGMAREAFSRGRTSSYAQSSTAGPINLNAPPLPTCPSPSLKRLSYLSEAPSHEGERSPFTNGWATASRASSLRPASIVSSWRPESITSFSAFSDMSGGTESSAPSFGYPRQRQQSSYTIQSLRTKAKESSIYVFVFSDLVVFATKQSEGLRGGLRRVGSKRDLKNSTSVTSLQSQRDDKAIKYKVVDDWGVSKITGVIDLSGKTEHDHLLQVDLLPVWSESNTRAFSPLSAGLATSVFLTIPDPPLKASGASVPAANSSGRAKEREAFLNAFEQSYLTSLRSISSVPMSRGLGSSMQTSMSSMSVGKNDKRDWRSSVASFSGSGTPLPKSPSVLAGERGTFEKGGPAHIGDNGFWSMRVRKVHKEVMEEEREAADYASEDKGSRVLVEQGFLVPQPSRAVPMSAPLKSSPQFTPAYSTENLAPPKKGRQRTLTGGSLFRRPR